MNRSYRKWLLVLVVALAAGAMWAARRGLAQDAPAATFTVSNTNDSGPGSLRQALSDANAATGTDTIVFNISGATRIDLLSPLPALTDSLVIDGATQPGFAGAPLIELSGTAAGSAVNGLTLLAGNSTVRSLRINSFAGSGLVISGGNGNTIQGNYLGVGGGNSQFGLIINSNANNIGGTAPAARNVISNNGLGGMLLDGAAAANNTIQGNYCGTTPDGSALAGNGDAGGIFLTNGANNNAIGGAASGAGNLISGNLGFGIRFTNSANGNTVKGNFIGTNAAGTGTLPNGDSGILINGSSNNTVGGLEAGAGNRIAHNFAPGFVGPGGAAPRIPNTAGTAHGVEIIGGGTGNSVLSNTIFNNQGQAILLASANNNQNAPNLTVAETLAAQFRLAGTLTSAANATFTLQFFENTDCDEAERLLNTRTVTTNSAGQAAFDFTITPSPAVPANRRITATATDPNGNTSAISPCRTVAPPPNTLTVVNTNDSGAGSLRQAILDANATLGAQTINFNIPGSGVQTILLFSPLPVVLDTARIDGTTQPGFTNAPLIELNGQGISGAGSGLSFLGQNGFIRSLIINRFPGSGITLTGNDFSVLQCYIGTNAAGTAAQPNSGPGIQVLSGDRPAILNNLISGNIGAGVALASSAGSIITGNFIGTDVTGTIDLGNGAGGLVLENVRQTRIGGTAAGQRNIISGNGRNGISIEGLVTPSSGEIAGNLIGTNIAGTGALGNDLNGIVAFNDVNLLTIGGTTPDTGNRIANNGSDGVLINLTPDRGLIVSVNQNAIFNNGGLGIRRPAPPAPLINTARTDGGITTVTGTFSGVAAGTATRLEFFDNAACDPSGAGEGAGYLGFVSVTANGTGAGSFTAPLPSVSVGRLITATLTTSLGDTSAFSLCAPVTPPPVSSTSLVGENVLVDLGDVTVVFTRVTTPGVTSAGAINPATAGVLPAPLTLTPDSRAFDVTTTAIYDGAVLVCLNNLTSVSDRQVFSRLRVLHGEGSSALIDRTVLPPADPGPNFAARRVCASVSSLSPFVLASLPVVAQTTFTISGRITNSSGSPDPGAAVTVTRASFTQTATTDANGDYNVSNLAPATYSVTPFRPGDAFAPASANVTITNADQVANFTLINNDNTRFSIGGRVTNSAGAALPGVQIILTGLGGTSVTNTNATGDYLFNGLVGGTYTVVPGQLGFNFVPAQRQFNDLRADVTNANFTGTVTPNPTPTPAPDDDFDSTVRDQTRWNLGVVSQPTGDFDPAVTITQGADPNPARNNRLRIQARSGVDGPSFNGYVSARTINLSSQSQVRVQAAQPATGSQAATSFAVGRDSDNFARFIVTSAPLPLLGPDFAALTAPAGPGPLIIFDSKVNGVTQNTLLPYNATAHQFWRFRYDAVNQILFFETSPNGNDSWTTQFQRPITATTVAALVSELIAGTFNSTINPGLAIFDQYRVAPPVGFQFSQSEFSASEGSRQALVTVQRFDSTSPIESPVSVNFATSNGTALAGVDYVATSGTLVFNPGENSKNIVVTIIDDSIFENTETFNVTLSNPVGTVIGERSMTTVRIADDEADNPINDPDFFVRQQYQDFLGRAAEPGGLAYWVGEITGCGNNSACGNLRRVGVSGAFFNEPEFFESGGFIDRFYRVAYPRNPTFAEFSAGQMSVASGPGAEGRRNAFAQAFTQTAEFQLRYGTVSDLSFVDALFANAVITPNLAERDFLIRSLASGTLTRAQVLRTVTDRAAADAAYRQRERNRLFVLMQYLGYLRRDPDTAGFNFWLNALNASGNVRGMVCSFITSAEYQRRFGTSITRTNAECAAIQ